MHFVKLTSNIIISQYSMKKLMIALGLGACIFGMTSCRKVCDCSLFQSNEKIHKYTLEREDRAQKCSDLTNTFEDENGKMSGIHCE